MSSPANETFSIRAQHVIVQQMLVDNAAAMVAKFPSDGKKINGALISREVFISAVKQSFGYISHDVTWPTALGARDVGRPAPKKATPKTSAPAKTTKTTPAKTTRTTKTTPAKPASTKTTPATAGASA